MKFPQDIKSACLGYWNGGQSFREYTNVYIFENHGSLILRRLNSMSDQVLEGPIIWDLDATFHTSIPLWTLIGDTEVRGDFQLDKHDLVLTLVSKNDGMAGQETNTVQLRRGDLQTWEENLETISASPTSLSSNIFPVGSAIDVNLTPYELSVEIAKLLASDVEDSERQIDGVLLLKDGKIIAESYKHGMNAKSVHPIASVTKSIVSLLCGVALDQGLVNLEDVISDSFPELRDKTSWGAEPQIRLKHLLSMTSGTKACGNVETQALLASECVEELVLGMERVQGPGERFRYDNGLPTVLAVFLERKTGMSFEKFTETYLFQPLGITDYHWTRLKQDSIDSDQLVLTSGGLSLTVPDMAKIGMLMLNEGISSGGRVLSQEFVKMSVQQQSPENFYPFGYGWHLNVGRRHFTKWEDAYMALGAGENVICVVPSRKIVFVAVCSSWRWPSLTPPILECLLSTVLKEVD
jgi:CubicO group peptidase (beta-lactamase class C family)